jgi:hypothetical protein
MAKNCSHALMICKQQWLTFSNIYKIFTDFKEKLLSSLHWKKAFR